MQIENHKEEVPFAFYEEKFRALDPASVTQRQVCPRYSKVMVFSRLSLRGSGSK